MRLAIRVACAVLVVGYAGLAVWFSATVAQFLVLSTGICEVIPLEESDVE